VIPTFEKIPGARAVAAEESIRFARRRAEAFHREPRETSSCSRALRTEAPVVESGLLGKIDAYERILFVAAHSERHTKQLLEVKADPKFPKQ